MKQKIIGAKDKEVSEDVRKGIIFVDLLEDVKLSKVKISISQIDTCSRNLKLLKVNPQFTFRILKSLSLSQ